MTEAREQTEQGFEHISKMFCNSIVKHCHDWIDSWLETEAAQDLQQCGTLAGVMKNLSLLKIANAESSTPASNSVPAPPAPALAAPASPSSRSLRKRH